MTLDTTDRTALIASLPQGGVGAEIGVLLAEFTEVIVEKAKPTRLFAIDCWQDSCRDRTDKDKRESINESYFRMYLSVLDKLSSHPCVRTIRAWSLEASRYFPDDMFDFVYIDADHNCCMDDCVAWWPKVKDGGWLLGHDYSLPAVARDVSELAMQLEKSVLVTEEPDWPSWAIQK